MEKTEFDEYVKQRYEKEIQWYDKKSMHNQQYYNRIQFTLIVCSAITPVVIALSFSFQSDVGKWISVGFAVITAIAASTLKIFKYYENWTNYRTVCETLKKEIYLYNASLDEYENATDKKSLFVERVETVISRENTLWLKTYKRDEKS